MSRTGRAIELLDDWREHPKDCTADHSGWTGDRYVGPCGVDAWAIVQELDMIDPLGRQEEIERLKAEVVRLRGQERVNFVPGEGLQVIEVDSGGTTKLIWPIEDTQEKSP